MYATVRAAIINHLMPLGTISRSNVVERNTPLASFFHFASVWRTSISVFGGEPPPVEAELPVWPDIDLAQRTLSQEVCVAIVQNLRGEKGEISIVGVRGS